MPGWASCWLTGCPTSCPLPLLARLYSLNHGDDRFECRGSRKVRAKEGTCAPMPPASARAAPGLREPPRRPRTTETDAVQARARASARDWKQTPRARGPPSHRATGFGDAPKPPHPSAGPQVSRAMSSGCTFRFWPRHPPDLSTGWKEEGRPQLLASSPANSRSQSGFGLLYPPHVTRPAALPPPRPPRPPAPAGKQPALPATSLPSSRAPRLLPSLPRKLFQLPPQAAVPSRRSPPPAAVPPPGLPSPQSELTVSKMAAVSVWGISAVRSGPPGSRLSSPQVSSRGASPVRSQLPSPRLSCPGVSSGASQGRRAAAGPAAACAASRCSAPGLGLGAAAAPSRPTPRPSPRRPPARSAPPLRRPSLRRRSTPGAGAHGRPAARPRSLGLLCGLARSPSGARPPSARRSRRRARTPGCAERAETRAGWSRAG